jgi:hypothetical protein
MDLEAALGLALLWALLLVAAAQTAVAWRVRRLEREEGLAVSPYRVPGSAAVCALVAVLVALATSSAFGPAPGPPADAEDLPGAGATAADTPEVKALRQEEEKLRARLREVEEEIARARQSAAPAAAPKPGEAARQAPPPPAPRLPFGKVALLLVPPLVIGGFLVLFFLGDPTSLVQLGLRMIGRDRGELRAKALEDLDALAAAAEHGRFQEGIAIADRTEVNSLEKLDQLDWSYLKSYCAAQHAMTLKDPAAARDLLAASARYLTTLLEQAPNRGEAAYLLAFVQSHLGKFQEALDGFLRAKQLLADPGKLPFPMNESVCLLLLAEEKLSRGESEEATRLFDEVTRRAVLVDKVPLALVRIRLLDVRRALESGRLGDAKEGLGAVRTLEGLGAEQERSVGILCDALETLIATRADQPAQVIEAVGRFLDRHTPAGLPEPDDEIADEYLESPVKAGELALPPQIYRAFLVRRAAASASLAAAMGQPPPSARVEEIARSLRRALQFELRQRDVLAALGGLYYWFAPEKRRKALQWLEAAAGMGVESLIARRILDRARLVERENRDVLDWFRSTSARFLHDPTLSESVRKALVEELGRFQEFRPFLLDLENLEDLAPREPTVRLLRERAAYLEKMVADLEARKTTGVNPRLLSLHREYARLIAGLDNSSVMLADIERQIVQEVGKLVLN